MRSPTTRRCVSESMFRNWAAFRQLLLMAAEMHKSCVFAAFTFMPQASVLLFVLKKKERSLDTFLFAVLREKGGKRSVPR